MRVLQDGHGSRICVLSLPADFGVADFCTFLGSFSKSVREMRIVRSEAAKSQCLVFLNFDNIKQAALFYKAYNGKAVSLRLWSDGNSHLHYRKEPRIKMYRERQHNSAVAWRHSAFKCVWHCQLT